MYHISVLLFTQLKNHSLKSIEIQGISFIQVQVCSYNIYIITPTHAAIPSPVLQLGELLYAMYASHIA